mgnify:CR=1 FL=1
MKINYYFICTSLPHKDILRKGIFLSFGDHLNINKEPAGVNYIIISPIWKARILVGDAITAPEVDYNIN